MKIRRYVAALSGFPQLSTTSAGTLERLKKRDLVGLILASLPTLIAVKMVGAWSYREEDPPRAFASTAHDPGA